MKKLVDLLQKLPSPLRNKYFITLLIFILWILLFDNYNLINQIKIQHKVKELEKQKLYYQNEIEKDSVELYKLKNLKKEQERFAREKFLMKKANEDVFIIRKNSDE